VYQVIAYLFFSGVCMGISYVAQDPITSYWVRATSFNLSISGLLSGTVMVATLAAMGKYELHWNWRTIQIIATLSIVICDSVPPTWLPGTSCAASGSGSDCRLSRTPRQA
jgi:hypothetical protein